MAWSRAAAFPGPARTSRPGKPAASLKAEEADRLQQAQRAQSIDIGGIFRRFEAHCDVALRAKIINFVGRDLRNDPGQVGAVGKIAVV